jgi:uncharacterized protein YjbI with pentapeptide repeats
VANPEHLDLLLKGVRPWNAWKVKNLSVRPDLSGAYLIEAVLTEADLFRANLFRADLSGAKLRGADLTEANLVGANLVGADLREAILFRANLSVVELRGANLGGANLSGAYLMGAQLVETNLEDAVLTDCHIYGISAWNVKLNAGTKQQDLVITRWDEPTVVVDKIEVAQFVYLLLQNEKMRDVIDTVGAQAASKRGGNVGLNIGVSCRSSSHCDGLGTVEFVALLLPLLPCEEFGERHRLPHGEVHGRQSTTVPHGGLP